MMRVYLPKSMVGVFLVLSSAFTPGKAAGAVQTIEVKRPAPYQVTQREGYVPRESHEHNPGGAKLGFADVAVHLELSTEGVEKVEGRLKDQKLPTDGRVPQNGESWEAIEGKIEGTSFQGVLRVPAGGWYRLEVRGMRGGEEVTSGSVEPFGVGEVFLVAGQSYAELANDERMTVQEPMGRVTLLDSSTGEWRVAHDPEAAAGEERGTIWPPFGDYLMPIARVPVGICNVAVGGTSSRQWLPGTPLHERLVRGGNGLSRFRAVLWQQGESDVIENVNREQYKKNLQLIREESAKVWKFEPTWLLAKSTMHPTVYNRPEEEGEIREAIGELWKQPGFGVGPDTDLLGGENRGGVMSRRHFSGIGQRRAGLMWFVAAMNEIERQAASEEVRLSR